MAEAEVTRRLAAVVAIDVAGYSRLMGADEAGTLARLKAHRAATDPIAEAHGGRLVGTAGDGLLFEFPSVVDAVVCIVEVQRVMAERNADLADDEKMLYRVGINLGDVLVDGDDIYGDGVNVAARLEALARPGGICISRSVRDNVRDRMAIALEDLGEVEVKNIARPVRVFRVLAGGETPIAPPRRRRVRRLAVMAMAVVLAALFGGGLWWWQPWLKRVEPADPARMTMPLPDKPSIAVLAFDNLTGVPDRQFLIDGFVEQLITTLARHPDILVIARNSSFTYRGQSVEVRQVAEELGVRYIIEGSLQQAGERIRINVQLIDAIKGFHVWSKAYDRPAADFFAVQDDVIGAIAVELLGRRGEILTAEHERIATKRAEDLTVYEIQEKTNVAYGKRTKDGNAEARRLTEKLLELDSDSARAHAFMAWIELMEYWQGWTEDRAATLTHACAAAERAIALDRREYQGHWAAAWCYIHTGRPDDARRAFEAAIRLNPTENGLTLNYATQVLLPAGRLDEAIAAVRNIERVNPKGRVIDQVYNALSTLYFEQADYRMSLDYISRMSEAFAKGRAFRIRRVAALHFLGRSQQARQELDAFLADQPGFAVATVAKAGGVPPKSTAAIQQALRALGVPEEPPLPLPDKPSIAVLPFQNMSGDAKQDYFADGMAEDITTDLSKVVGLVVAPSSATRRFGEDNLDLSVVAGKLRVRHILEGGVRRAGERLRITVKLIDAAAGVQVWAERYDRDLKDIFAIQDDIADRVVAALSKRLEEGSLNRVARSYTPNVEAYDLYIQGRAKRIPPTPANLTAALEMFEKAIEIDPGFAGGYAGAAYVHILRYGNPSLRGTLPSDDLEAALRLAEKAVALDPTFGPAWGSLSEAYARKSRFDDALQAIETAMKAAPNDSLMRATYGRLLGHIGRPEEGIEQVKQAMRMSPDSLPMLYFLGANYRAAGQFDNAIEALTEHRKRLGGRVIPAPTTQLIAAYVQAGSLEKARAEAQALLRASPGFTSADASRTHLYKYRDEMDRFIAALREAGVPE